MNHHIICQKEIKIAKLVSLVTLIIISNRTCAQAQPTAHHISIKKKTALLFDCLLLFIKKERNGQVKRASSQRYSEGSSVSWYGL